MDKPNDTAQGDPEQSKDVHGRRDVLKKAAAAGITAGVVWSAPRVEGLSLRPDYAAAQTGGGASFDLTLSASGHAIVVASGGIDGLPPGLFSADMYFSLFALGGSQDAQWVASIVGSAAGVNCSITGLDGSQNWPDLVAVTAPFDAPPLIDSSPGGYQRAVRTASGTSSNSGSTTLTLHVTCT